MKFFLFILSVLATFSLSASHIVGGEIYYDCLGGNQYRVTVKIYRDCNSTGASFDQNLPITVFNGNNAQIDLFSIPFPGSTNLPVNFNNNPCVTAPGNICVEEAIYQQVVTLTGSTTGYLLSYQRCCRGPNVTNLFNPGDQGLTLVAQIPPDNVVTCNSSPRFSNFPPLLLCANSVLQFDHSATDPDGDLLVYSLCAPFQGGTSSAPAPNPAGPPPYNLVAWAGGGYSALNPFGMGPISIDPVTGWLTATPQVVGLYAVGICVQEYRNGVLLSTNTRDFLFRVLDCAIDLEAAITPQEDLVTFVSFCQGAEIHFENDSYGGSTYAWDFGVPGISTDVSSDFEPSYTFPTPGTYVVTLIVSISQGCSDTAEQTFIINDELDGFFVPPSPQCIVDNSFDFVGDGILPAGTTYSWDFGPFATPSTSTDLSPTNVVFTTSGSIPVTFTVSFENCDDTHEEDIFVYAEPTIGFGVKNELRCAPFTVNFVNQSFAHTPIFSLWDFGDGTPALASSNPSHLYSEPGVYDVSLVIFTDAGCIDTLYLTKPEFIEIFPKPVSIFEVDPLVQEQYSAHFTFTDLSDDDVTKQSLHFGDGSFTQLSEFTYTYPEPGVYHPYQIVRNQFGCRDSSRAMVTVIPVIPIMVPNAFTPDGNEFNNTFKPILYKPQNYRMWIYNRWGELLFFSESPDAEWDGQYAGTDVLDGIYLWRIIYNEYDTGKPKEIRGHVTLLR